MPNRSTPAQRLLVTGMLLAAALVAYPLAAGRQPSPQAAKPGAATSARVEPKAVIDQYCIGCHSERMKQAGLVLEKRDYSKIAEDAETWEKVVRKLKAGMMPPLGSRRPDATTHTALIASIENALDKAGAADTNPGRPPIHRLNRSEYTNAIRDIFGLEIDGKTMLPADDTGYGFDNIADVLTISPGLLERYMLAASKISRLVVGDTSMRPNSGIYEIPYLSLAQDERMSEALPFGSRGGVAIKHYFPLDGEYTLRFFLQRSDLAASYAPRGLDVANDIDIRLDRERVKLIRLGGKTRGAGAYDTGKNEGYDADAGVEVRFLAKAGMRTVGISLNKDRWLPEGVGVGRLPLTNNATALGINSSASYGRVEAGLDKVIITGPYNGDLPEESAIRRRVFVCEPSAPREEEACAKRILSRLARLAYRRPASESDVQMLMKFFHEGRTDASFDRGIQTALTRLLVDINFLFRPIRDPQGVAPGAVYKLSDLEIASRLSFFLWSSLPDDELLTLAEQNKLRSPGVIEKQVRRMLADPKSSAMMESFFGQWLTTRNVRSARPDPKVYPDFDENLRNAFQEETKLFLESQIREDRPVPELLTANYTFVNDRLAKHYGIPGIEGNQFRRVTLPGDARAGLLGQGSVLMVTSYNDRTSVVVRGKFIMDTVFGTPPPPPPPNIPPLEDTKIEGSLRQRMELHRKNPVCATCHNTIDPLGFAFENFDGTGKFRTLDSHTPVDPSGVLADGTKFDGPASFRKAIVARQDAFLTTLTEKLLTYALGRGVETYDMPAVRKILRESARTDYRWSSLVTEIVKSMPFQMRRAES